MNSIPFDVGDEVEVIGGCYTFSKYSSIGKVCEVTGNIFKVEFTNLTCSYNNYGKLPTNFPFHISEVQNFRLLSLANSNPHNKKYEKIINKMTQLQNKRKAKGYAF
jgi:hypothetical protein